MDIEKYGRGATATATSSPVTKDELLTNLTIIGSRARSRPRTASTPRRGGPVRCVTTRRQGPGTDGLREVPGDAFKPTRRWVEELYDIRRWSEVKRGDTSPRSRCPNCCPRRSASSLVASNNYFGHLDRNMGPTCQSRRDALIARPLRHNMPTHYRFGGGGAVRRLDDAARRALEVALAAAAAIGDTMRDGVPPLRPLCGGRGTWPRSPKLFVLDRSARRARHPEDS